MHPPYINGSVLRRLGAFERTIDLFMLRNPVQYSLVAEVDRPVAESDLRRALQQMQAAHPLLGATVDRGTYPDATALFRHTDNPVPLRMANAGSSWQDQAIPRGKIDQRHRGAEPDMASPAAGATSGRRPELPAEPTG